MNNRIRLLLVLDHDFFRKSMRRSLEEQADFQIVGEASSEEEALRQRFTSQPDAILLDTAQSRVNDTESIRRIANAHLPATVVVVTAYDHEEPVWSIMDPDAHGYARGNLRKRELLGALRAVRTKRDDGSIHPEFRANMTQGVPTKRFPHLARHRLSLSEREIEIVQLAMDGLINKEIARKLGVGDRTVQSHWRNIFNKLGVGTKLEVVMFCLRRGWIEMEKDSEDRRSLT